MAKSEATKEIEALKLDHGQVTRTKSIFNKDQTQLLYQKTPDKHIYTRPGKGGGVWRFPKSYYIRQKLNSLFGFDWDFQILTSLDEAMNTAKLTGSCVVQGKLTGRVVDDNGRIREVTRMQWGRSEVKWKMTGPNNAKTKVIDDWSGAPVPLDFGNDMKAATTDCLKKCASQFGIAADIYDSEDFMELTIADSVDDQAAGAKRKAAQLKAAKQKKVVSSGSDKVGEQNEKPGVQK